MVQNPVTEKQRNALRRIVNRMGYPAYLRWLDRNEPDIQANFMTCGQAQRVIAKLQNHIPEAAAEAERAAPVKSGRIELPIYADLKLVRTRAGIVALHLCLPPSMGGRIARGGTTGEHSALGDPKHCAAWLRIPPACGGTYREGGIPSACGGTYREGGVEEGNWRQRHMQGYGVMCRTCGKLMPTEPVLEALYRAAEADGLETLEALDV